jgi:hypothetical protein
MDNADTRLRHRRRAAREARRTVHHMNSDLRSLGGADRATIQFDSVHRSCTHDSPPTSQQPRFAHRRKVRAERCRHAGRCRSVGVAFTRRLSPRTGIGLRCLRPSVVFSEEVALVGKSVTTRVAPLLACGSASERARRWHRSSVGQRPWATSEDSSRRFGEEQTRRLQGRSRERSDRTCAWPWLEAASGAAAPGAATKASASDLRFGSQPIASGARRYWADFLGPAGRRSTRFVPAIDHWSTVLTCVQYGRS